MPTSRPSLLFHSHLPMFSLGFNRDLEGAFISSPVDGGALVARVGAICLGLNSSTSDQAEKLPSNPLLVSNILYTIKGKYA